MSHVLHYFYDPLCGWCYASHPLMEAIRTVPGLTIRMHPGGMLAGMNRQMTSAALREFVLGHVRRITAMSGQRFTEAYTDQLLGDPTVILDSEPPTGAILAAVELGCDGLDVLAHIQRAQYLDGRRVSEPATLTELAVELGLDRTAFSERLHYLRGTAVRDHIERSRRFMHEVGGQGFPTFALETGGQRELLDIAQWLGRPDAWRAEIERRVRRASH
ncbi:MAG TPA: DsbA family protein [Steroidobacteraceae bacterium]|jgi:putative protein-disulfide isomerase|nr:DsbA family protein [Steroidobacteraceae bacterium]